MNIIPFAGEGLTMSSHEIAELTEKRHGDVIRDTRVMLEALGDDADLRHVQETKDSRGYTAEISLPKDLTLTLVSGYNVKLRKRIIDRWMELEEKATQPAIPQTLPEALRLAAEAIEKSEKLALENKAQAEALDPHSATAAPSQTGR
ncbi:Rha family transcriptional regulator [Azovibrio restrictus]|uniref:Rha family transcriptional regulator n=1 Tax=Azovibrio restrictus TaxID=146938 RepID=UPI0026EBF5D9|nr:Rha family transcriptional regulator [Azovibrio restrictus]MDD3481823.1 Rha family transcriptional regulator [Azovibrio restrictus]